MTLVPLRAKTRCLILCQQQQHRGLASQAAAPTTRTRTRTRGTGRPAPLLARLQIPRIAEKEKTQFDWSAWTDDAVNGPEQAGDSMATTALPSHDEGIWKTAFGKRPAKTWGNAGPNELLPPSDFMGHIRQALDGLRSPVGQTGGGPGYGAGFGSGIGSSSSSSSSGQSVAGLSLSLREDLFDTIETPFTANSNTSIGHFGLDLGLQSPVEAKIHGDFYAAQQLDLLHKARNMWDAYDKVRQTSDLLSTMSTRTFAQLAEAIARGPTAADARTRSRILGSDVWAYRNVRTIIEDLISLGQAPDELMSKVLAIAAAPALRTSEDVSSFFAFCTLHSVSLEAPHLDYLLQGVAYSGNYTIFLEFLSELSSPQRNWKPKFPDTYMTMLLAVSRAKLESLEGAIGRTVEERQIGDLNMEGAEEKELDLDEYLGEIVLPTSTETEQLFASDVNPRKLYTPIEKALLVFRYFATTNMPKDETASKPTESQKLAALHMLLATCLNSGQVELALKLIDEVGKPKFGITANARTYSKFFAYFLHQITQLGVWEPLVEPLPRVVELAQDAGKVWTKMVGSGVEPSTAATSTMFRIYLLSDQHEKSLETLRSLQPLQPGNPAIALVQYQKIMDSIVNHVLAVGDTIGAFAFVQLLLMVTRTSNEAAITAMEKASKAGTSVGEGMAVVNVPLPIARLLEHLRAERNMAALKQLKGMLAPGTQESFAAVKALVVEHAARGNVGGLVESLSGLPTRAWQRDMDLWATFTQSLARASQNELATTRESTPAQKKWAAVYRDLAMELWKARVDRVKIRAAAAPGVLRLSLPFVGMNGPRIDLESARYTIDSVASGGELEQLRRVWKDCGELVEVLTKPLEEVSEKRVEAIGELMAAYVEALAKFGRHGEAKDFVMGGFGGVSVLQGETGRGAAGAKAARRLLDMWATPNGGVREGIEVDMCQRPELPLESLQLELTAKFGKEFMSLVDSLPTLAQLEAQQRINFKETDFDLPTLPASYLKGLKPLEGVAKLWADWTGQYRKAVVEAKSAAAAAAAAGSA